MGTMHVLMLPLVCLNNHETGDLILPKSTFAHKQNAKLATDWKPPGNNCNYCKVLSI
uniref:Uncharacterized protein n=1 Tax=Aegilops tauschii subsp. strangulata TaxID=200361 RepID=A0A453IXG2_AEGTS